MLVRIFHFGEPPLIQNYNPPPLLEALGEPENEPEIFNQAIQDMKPNEIGICLSEYENFISEDVIETVLKVFQNHPEFGVIYTDSLLDDNEQFFPTYRYGLQAILNTPFFFRGQYKFQFNEEIKYLYFCDGLRKLSEQTLLYHMAVPLLTIGSRNEDFREDVKLLNG
jgi:hypothetical protein